MSEVAMYGRKEFDAKIEKINELEAELAELSADYHGERLRADSLFDQLAALREAVWIVGAERGIHRYYKPMDVAIDSALSLLQEKGGE